MLANDVARFAGTNNDSGLRPTERASANQFDSSTVAYPAALIPDEKPDRADAKIVEYLYHFAEQVREDKEKYNARVRKRVNGILKFAGKETITKSGKELARNLPRECGGKSAQAFFEESYNGRSHLVHGNVEDGKRPPASDTSSVCSQSSRDSSWIFSTLR